LRSIAEVDDADQVINGGNGGKLPIFINYFYIDSYREFMEIAINAPLAPSTPPAIVSLGDLLRKKISD
jgi:hypothetical protein